VDNAKRHLGARYVYNLDLKDFFPSIDQARVWKCLQLDPFNLKQTLVQPGLMDEELEVRILDIIWKAVKYDEDLDLVYIKFRNTQLFEIGEFTYHLPSNEKVHYAVRSINEKEVHITVDFKNSQFEYLRDKVNKLQGVETDMQDTKLILALFRYSIRHNRLYIKKDNRNTLCNLIASLCCTEMAVERMNDEGAWITTQRNVLPQGAPTSPVLTNIICRKLDHKLTGVAKRFGLSYTRYADDITFSSMHSVYQENGEFLTELHRIIREQGFHVKTNKTRLQKDGYRKEVTGLRVHDKVNVSKKYVKQLRMWLYLWEKYGIEKASQLFTADYLRTGKDVKSIMVPMPNVMLGKLRFLKMVRGSEDNLVKSLHNRFERLTGQHDEIEDLLNVWENEGIGQAIETFVSIS
jgi:hypothetical protein